MNKCFYCGLPINSERKNKLYHETCRQKYFYWYVQEKEKTDSLAPMLVKLVQDNKLHPSILMFLHDLPPPVSVEVIQAMGYKWKHNRWIERSLD